MKTIETERLRLIPWKEEYAQSLYNYAKDPDVGPAAGWKPHEDEAESLDIIRTLFLPNNVWAITEKTGGDIIGTVGLEPDKRRPLVNSKEIGYSMSKEYWGKGLMTEAVSAVIDFAFEVYELDVLSACVWPSNEKSQKVVKKTGFTYEGTERRSFKVYDGTVRDTKCYSILREEWIQMKGERNEQTGDHKTSAGADG